jgi:hypothetical protein
MAWVQPTTPAKQHSMSMLPSTFAALSTAEAIWASSRTSTASVMMRRSGKRACSFLMRSKAASGFTSQRARPEAPCSRRASAASRARVPAPPVTRSTLVREHAGGQEQGVYPCFHVLMALPWTSNRNCALSAGLRLSGGGRAFVNGLSAVDSVISGSCLLTRDALSSPSPAILRFEVAVVVLIASSTECVNHCETLKKGKCFGLFCN